MAVLLSFRETTMANQLGCEQHGIEITERDDAVPETQRAVLRRPALLLRFGSRLPGPKPAAS